ncbi:small metal-binding protein SmbP [Nitrosomonas marina]|uniref:Small metal-binding protein n=1 Tax=Nitrosomonas marina TaxID=917 RepID=A0A1H8GLA6_9PROT|nr:small metal-binding protein SmbP [Nitrosomonas marina]SEN44931.1 Small metal-binding protein [Nitrosomonas marina]
MNSLSAHLILVIFSLLFNTLANASNYKDDDFDGGKRWMLEAIDHAKTAKSHKAHAHHIHEHAKESLKYVKKAEIVAIEQNNTEGRVHITTAIQHLVKAINQADDGRSRIAIEHLSIALEAMRQFTEHQH